MLNKGEVETIVTKSRQRGEKRAWRRGMRWRRWRKTGLVWLSKDDDPNGKSMQAVRGRTVYEVRDCAADLDWSPLCHAGLPWGSLQYEYSWVDFSHHHWQAQIGRGRRAQWHILCEGPNQGGSGGEFSACTFSLSPGTRVTPLDDALIGLGSLRHFQGEAPVGKWQVAASSGDLWES